RGGGEERDRACPKRIVPRRICRYEGHTMISCVSSMRNFLPLTRSYAAESRRRQVETGVQSLAHEPGDLVDARTLHARGGSGAADADLGSAGQTHDRHADGHDAVLA